MKVSDLFEKTDTIEANAASIVKSLSALATWFNIAQGNAAASKLPAAIKTLVDIFGYTPHSGSVYRSFYYKEKPCPKVGDIVRINTGLRSVQSWTGNEKKLTLFYGNEFNRLHVELLSPELELLNMGWLRSILQKIQNSARNNNNKKLLDAVEDIRATIRPKGRWDDEDEVIMQINQPAKVKVLRVISQYKG